MQREVSLPSVGARLWRSAFAAMIARIAGSKAGEGQLQMFRLRFAALNMTGAFCAFSEMQKGNLEVANGDRWRMGAICNLLLGESAGGNLRELRSRSHPRCLQRLNSSRRRFVCARLTGISVCFLSFMRSW